jgi:hypothetical protein
MTRQVTRLVADRSVGRLRTNGPLVSASGDLGGEAPVSERGDNQAAARVGGIRLRMTWRTERHQAVEIEVRALLGALEDVVDLQGAPAATGVAPPAGARTTWHAFPRAIPIVPFVLVALEEWLPRALAPRGDRPRRCGGRSGVDRERAVYDGAPKKSGGSLDLPMIVSGLP